MEQDNLYLKHILESIHAIEQYVKDIKFEEFVDNKLVQDGVIRNLEIVGEASKRLSDEFKQAHQYIPWKDIAGMRDKLIHDYMGVDLLVVWETIKHDVPFLKLKLGQDQVP